jgi:hypothetical protein
MIMSEENISLGRYKVLEQSETSFKLKRKLEFKGWWSISYYTLFIVAPLIAVASQLVVLDNFRTTITVTPFVLLLCLILSAMGRYKILKTPSRVILQRGIITMYHPKFFGGTVESQHLSSSIQYVQPGYIPPKGKGKHYGNSAVRLYFTNGHYEELTLSSYSPNDIDLATNESTLVAKIFSSILGVELKSYYFE